MERWKKLNVLVSVGGLAFFLVSILFVKYNPLIFCLAAFGLGVAWKGFKNIYKNVDPPNREKVSNPYDKNVVKNKKQKKKRKR
ncbi:MAG TPA: hypothetical protein DDY58_17685 [Terrisporobacter glycolicus]|uniref:Uncharacterized protein n=1 Tax=Terrisporobacter petrolearius TaxID=1460447 RepID=A0ABZ3FFH7_9FIRM|nr:MULTISPECIES: hypothetical protein [Terrisporobacter]MBN9645933.1 hypothetical protein [Terrisporobacter glycolicus]HBI94099.1 hypothetical protein [Terrisporobacter hibernicus]